MTKSYEKHVPLHTYPNLAVVKNEVSENDQMEHMHDTSELSLIFALYKINTWI